MRTFKYNFNIKSETDLSDSNVTLVCDEHRQINAHKIVKDKWAQSRNQLNWEVIVTFVCKDIQQHEAHKAQ